MKGLYWRRHDLKNGSCSFVNSAKVQFDFILYFFLLAASWLDKAFPLRFPRYVQRKREWDACTMVGGRRVVAGLPIQWIRTSSSLRDGMISIGNVAIRRRPEYVRYLVVKMASIRLRSIKFLLALTFRCSLHKMHTYPFEREPQKNRIVYNSGISSICGVIRPLKCFWNFYIYFVFRTQWTMASRERRSGTNVRSSQRGCIGEGVGGGGQPVAKCNYNGKTSIEL